jgi:hypothetical protein
MRTYLKLVLGLLVGACTTPGVDGEAALGQDDAEVGVITGFSLRETSTSSCLDIATNNGRLETRLNDCNPVNGNQRWEFNGGVLRHSATGLCLDIPSSSLADGTGVQLFPCNGNANQDFRLYPVLESANSVVSHWFLVVRHSGKCIVKGGSPSGAVQGPCNITVQSSWYLVS